MLPDNERSFVFYPEPQCPSSPISRPPSAARIFSMRRSVVSRAHGFHRSTMQIICREAGISAGALYLYFPSKEALIEGLTERDREQMMGQFAGAGGVGRFHGDDRGGAALLHSRAARSQAEPVAGDRRGGDAQSRHRSDDGAFRRICQRLAARLARARDLCRRHRAGDRARRCRHRDGADRRRPVLASRDQSRLRRRTGLAACPCDAGGARQTRPPRGRQDFFQTTRSGIRHDDFSQAILSHTVPRGFSRLRRRAQRHPVPSPAPPGRPRRPASPWWRRPRGVSSRP